MALAKDVPRQPRLKGLGEQTPVLEWPWIHEGVENGGHFSVNLPPVLSLV